MKILNILNNKIFKKKSDVELAEIDELDLLSNPDDIRELEVLESLINPVIEDLDNLENQSSLEIENVEIEDENDLNTSEIEDKLKKIEIFRELACDRYIGSIAKARKVEEKASKVFTVLNILIIVNVAALSQPALWRGVKLLNIWLLLAFGFIVLTSIILMFMGWVWLYKSFNSYGIMTVEPDDDIYDIVTDDELNVGYLNSQLAENYKIAATSNNKLSEERYDYYSKAIKWVRRFFIAFAFFLLFMVFIISYGVFMNKNVNENNQTKETGIELKVKARTPSGVVKNFSVTMENGVVTRKRELPRTIRQSACRTRKPKSRSRVDSHGFPIGRLKPTALRASVDSNKEKINSHYRSVMKEALTN